METEKSESPEETKPNPEAKGPAIEHARRLPSLTSNKAGLVITTLISVLVTIGVAWYQLNRSQNQAALAEMERKNTVRNSLARIIHES